MLRTQSYGSVEISSVDRPALLAALSERARRLAEAHPEIEQVLLFGSFARGDYTPESDVDLLIVVATTDMPFLERADPYLDILSGLPFDVLPIVYTRAELSQMQNAGNAFLLSALNDAVQLPTTPRTQPIHKEERIFEGAMESREVTNAQEFMAYLDSLVADLRLLRLPRVEAMLHGLRAVQSLHNVGDALARRGNAWRHYRSLRTAQDVLRYLPFEVIRHCPEGGTLRRSSSSEMELACATASYFSTLSKVRDELESSRAGFQDIEIDRGQRVIRFPVSDHGLRDVARQHEGLSSRAQRAELAVMALDQQMIQDAVRRVFKTVTPGPRNRDFAFPWSDEVSGILVEAMLAQDPYVMASESLPGNWSIGPYTVAEFRRFFAVIQAIVSLQELIFLQFCAETHGHVVPWNGAVPLLHKTELLRRVCLHAGLKPETVEEIAKDLSYDPLNVKWTEVQYQPLIPLLDDIYALVPVVIGGSNYERNLLALIDRLPWRRGAAEGVKTDRENLMLEKILAETASKGFETRSRTPLRDGSRVLGDIDLLVWQEDPSEALAVSLKWFYGPDSVQEVSNHSERYREGIARHRNLVEYLRAHADDVSRRFSLRPTIGANTAIYPVFVTYLDEVRERDRCSDIPTVTLASLLEAFRTVDGPLRAIFEHLRAVSGGVPHVELEVRETSYQLGEYEVRISHPVVRGAMAPGDDEATSSLV